MLNAKGFLKQLESARDAAAKELARLEATIKAFSGSVSSARAAVGKRGMSDAAKNKIRLAQKKRWKEWRKQKAAKGRKVATKHRLPAAPNA